MRFLAALLLLTASPAQAGEVNLDFDDVPSVTVVDTYYAAWGVILTGIGDGGPFEVQAKASCVTSSSAPNVVAVDNGRACPELIDPFGFVRAEFATPQPRVSVMVTHVTAGTATYLRAFDGTKFLDWKFGNSGVSSVGVPQKIEITRDANQTWITAVEFGAFANSGPASFDDLHFAIGPLAAEARTWSTLKARY